MHINELNSSEESKYEILLVKIHIIGEQFKS